VLPRAITFTGTFYSLGIPPEFLGTGRGLKDAEREGLLDVLLHYYRHLKDDLVRAGHFLNWENLHLLEKEAPVWSKVRHDIELCQHLLQLEFGPKETHHYLHRNASSSIFHLWRNGGDERRLRFYIVETAQLRRSLG
jgi:phosphoenolpyruvate carboxylase